MATREELYEEAMQDFALGEFPTAEEKFRRALELDANYFDAWHALAETRFRRGDLDGALAAGKRAIELRPDDPLAHTSMSRIYVKKGMVPEAEHHAAQSRIAGWKEQLQKPTPPTPQ